MSVESVDADILSVIEADTPVHYIPYAYNHLTEVRKDGTPNTSYTLRIGSLHFHAAAGNATSWVQDGEASRFQDALPCQWVADAPGKALSFNGSNDFVGAKKSSKINFGFLTK